MTEYYRLIAVLAAQVNIQDLLCISFSNFCCAVIFVVPLNRNISTVLLMWCDVMLSIIIGPDVPMYCCST